MSDNQTQDNNQKKGRIPAWLLNDSSSGQGNSTAQSSSKQAQTEKEYPVNTWVLEKVFGRHPFVNAIMLNMEKYLWERGCDNSTAMTRMDKIIRTGEGLKKGDSAIMTEKTVHRIEAIKNDLDAKKASMSKEAYLAKAAEYELEAFFRHYPELKNELWKEEKETKEAPLSFPSLAEQRFSHAEDNKE